MEKRFRGHPSLGVVNTSPTLLGLVLVWSQQNYLKLLFQVRLGLLLPRATLLRGKAGMKMKGMNKTYVISFIHRCLKVLA